MDDEKQTAGVRIASNSGKAAAVAAMAGCLAAGLDPALSIGAAAVTLAAAEAGRGLGVRSLRLRASQPGHRASGSAGQASGI